MTREEQHNWLDQQMLRDPYWASTEMDVRKAAVEISGALARGEPHITMAVRRPDRDSKIAISFDELRFDSRDFLYVGGLEGLLLIEERIRRAQRG
jgi:hypothetical protein